MKEIVNVKCWRVCGGIGNFIYCGGSVDLYNYFGKLIGSIY